MTGHWRTAAVIHSSPKKTLRFFGPLARVLLSTTAREAKKRMTPPECCSGTDAAVKNISPLGFSLHMARGDSSESSGREGDWSAKITAP